MAHLKQSIPKSSSAQRRGCKAVVAINCCMVARKVGPNSSVGIETRYGLDGPGIESRGGGIFLTRPDRPWGTPNLMYDGYRVFPGVKAAGAWR